MSPNCACYEHDKWSADGTKVYKLSRRKFRVSTVQHMKSKNYMPGYGSALCVDCVKYVENHILSKRPKVRNSHVDKVIEMLEDGSLEDQDMIDLATALGKRVSDHIITTDNLVSDKDALVNNMNTTTYLKQKNDVLVSFISSAVACPDGDNQKKVMQIIGAVDYVYKGRHLNYVSPFSFCKNLIAYSVSGSKLVTQLNSIQASGSYSLVRNWLRQNSIERVTSMPNSDIMTFFDNNQVVCRNWRVSFNYKTNVNVITNIIHIASGNSKLQYKPELSPKHWLHPMDNVDAIARLRKQLMDMGVVYDTVRLTFLQDRLKKVMTEADPVCSEADSSDAVQDEDPYAWVDDGHGDEVTIKGEPAMLNPCSYDSVQKVLEHIQSSHADNGDGRQWLCIGCDGLPYTLGSRLIADHQHLQDILLVPGLGHLEMNMVKLASSYYGTLFLRILLRCWDTEHPGLWSAVISVRTIKAWMILTIFLFGTLDEILHVYHEHSQGTELSVKGLYQFIGNATNANFRFLANAVFEVVLPVFIFSCGVRRNNASVIAAAKHKFNRLFFGMNMTCYQELCFRDMVMRCTAPADITQYLEGRESFSASGHHSKGEGGDFILEAFNAKTKRWLPPGIPQAHHWQQICRNIETLDEIRKLNVGACGTGEEKRIYQRDIRKEVKEWRKRLRSSGYLSNHNISAPHISIGGRPLDTDLVDFTTLCSDNMESYFNHVETGLTPGKRVSLKPVFVTPEDRQKFHSIEKKTKAEIATYIDIMLDSIQSNGDIAIANVLRKQWTNIKVSTKDDILQFYKEVSTALENSTIAEGSTDEDESDTSDYE